MRLHARLREAARRQPHADIAIAATVFAVTLVTTAAGPNGARLDPAAVGIAAVACGALAVRRRFPLTTLAFSGVAAEAYLVYLHGRHASMVLAAPLIALYTVAEASPRRRSLIIGVLAVFAFAGLHMIVKPVSGLGAENLALAALGGLAVAAGEAARHRRAYLAEVEARARQAEADREAEAARRVAQERLRIARDLHDDVGHHLALIHVQARVATHALDHGPGPAPAEARRALAHIRDATKAALDELGETIGLLRQPGDRTAPVSPVAGLAGVESLLAAFRHSGMRITERVRGDVRPVPPAADLTAYRVIQEALTNVCKHAGPTAAELIVIYDDDALRIVVDNGAPGPGPRPGTEAATEAATEASPDGGRHGLVGMRERVIALGGSLHAGPRPDGGYRVTAVLPAAAASATRSAA
ncbi:MAG TPA: histidine kinase [Micromonosporaceae bacterium]|nr:histidine kinase [Micromonosporaceae bacterium]